MTQLPDIVTADDRLPATQTFPDRARNPYWVYLDNLQSGESKRTMKGCLDRIARLLFAGHPNANEEHSGELVPWHQLQYEHTIRVRALLIEDNLSPAYINKHLVAMRRVLKEAWRLGLITAEHRDRASDLPMVKGSRLPAGTHVPPESLAAVLGVCDAAAASDKDADRVAGTRDGAMLAALYSTGCRRAELTGLTLADYDPATRSLRVRGKGDKERVVYLIPDAMARVEAWIAVRGRTPGALFPPLRKGGKFRTDPRGWPVHMTPRALGTILDARYTQAAVARRTPHDFRRTFVGELLDAGVDLATVQGLTGHASPATTARYDRRPERRRQEATDKLTLPKPRPPRPKGDPVP
ncbi:tyrosine-type recombinase/integrase [Microbispora sp. ZYX-F-249]|uniref:Tyrosine-type recombinase/integrase n=1 Tax=Microbispora maris TaxID=3144104 RepID=A0ABV0B0C3_9ACTN